MNWLTILRMVYTFFCASASCLYAFMIYTSNLEHGSQPLKPTTALRLTEYGFPFPYCPNMRHVAEQSAIAAPILKPPIPSLTAKQQNKYVSSNSVAIVLASVEKVCQQQLLLGDAQGIHKKIKSSKDFESYHSQVNLNWPTSSVLETQEGINSMEQQKLKRREGKR